MYVFISVYLASNKGISDALHSRIQCIDARNPYMISRYKTPYNVSHVEGTSSGTIFSAVDRNGTLCPSCQLSCLYLVSFILTGGGVFSLIASPPPPSTQVKKLRRLSLPGVKNSLQNSKCVTCHLSP